MVDQLSATNTLAKSKRKNPIDNLMIFGVILIASSLSGIYFFAAKGWLILFPIIIFCLGVFLICYSIKMHHHFCKNAPEMLLPVETQIQSKIIQMLLTDNISEANKVDILKQISSGPNNHPSIGND